MKMRSRHASSCPARMRCTPHHTAKASLERPCPSCAGKGTRVEIRSGATVRTNVHEGVLCHHGYSPPAATALRAYSLVTSRVTHHRRVSSELSCCPQSG